MSTYQVKVKFLGGAMQDIIVIADSYTNAVAEAVNKAGSAVICAISVCLCEV